MNILHAGGDAFFAIMGDRPKGPPHAAEKGVIVFVLAPLSKKIQNTKHQKIPRPDSHKPPKYPKIQKIPKINAER